MLFFSNPCFIAAPNSPFGRYCFLSLLLGLITLQDVFQQKMDIILESCPGTLGIADDVAVFGRTEIERDANLHNVMIVSRQHGLLFNGKTRQIMIAARRWSVTSSKPEKQNMNRSRHMCQYINY